MIGPIRLAPNQPAARPYKGGAGILALRGTGSTDDHAPEDFVASVTTTHGSDTVGLTVLDDGRTLRDAIAADPVAYLGQEHVDAHGADTGLLVKLLSTGERLFNHVHPGGAFAAEHLGSPRGKTEAWFIVDAGPTGEATVWLGFRNRVDPAQVRRWVDAQDGAALLSQLHEITVRPGDWLYVPAGMPHSIGPGVTLVELQEPSDLSIILEYAPYPLLDPADAFLGLDVDTALQALDLEPLPADRLGDVHGRPDDGARSRLFPPAADAYFRAEIIAPTEPVAVDPGFAVLVVLDGDGRLDFGDADTMPLTRGDVLLVPHSARATTIDGGVRVVRCSPAAA